MPIFTNQDTRTSSTASLKCPYCYLQTDFTPCYSASIADFKQVKAGWTEATTVTVLLQRCSEPVESLKNTPEEVHFLVKLWFTYIQINENLNSRTDILQGL